MRQSAIVSDHRILRGMETKGFIKRNGTAKSRERHWTGQSVPVITVEAGPKLDNWFTPFEYRGQTYRIKYFDGCFKPFVVRLNLPHPSFV